MPVIVNPGTYTVQTDSTPVYQDWHFAPDAIEINYIQGQPMPAPIVVSTQFKDVIGVPGILQFPVYKYRTWVTVSATLPVCVVLSSATFATGSTNYATYTNGMSGNMTYTFQNLNLLSPGTYYFNVYHHITGILPGAYTYPLTEKIVPIKINVFASTAPAISPGSFEFTWVENTPWVVQHQDFVISGQNWTVRCPKHFQLYSTYTSSTPLPDGGFMISGSGTKTVSLYLMQSIGDIEENPFITNLIVNGGQITPQIKVIRLTSGGLFLERDSLYFIAYKGITNADPQQILISFPSSYYAELPPWITVAPTMNGFTNTYVFSVLPSENMEPGHYIGKIIIKNSADNSVIGIISVVYDVIGAINSPYRPGEYAFTLDNNFIGFQSEVDDTYYNIVVKAKIYNYYSSTFRELQFPFTAALFQRRVDFNIGRIIDRLMATLPDFNESSSTPYLPAEVSLTATELKRDDPDYIQEYELEDILFVAGLDPGLIAGNGILDINPRASRATPGAYTFLNLLIKGFSTLRIIRHRGPEAEEMNSSIISPGIHSLKLYFSEFESRPGDIIECRLEINEEQSVSKFYKIFPEALESNFIVWENEYKLKSVIEFTGDYQVKSEIENRTQSLVQKLVDVLVKLGDQKTSKLTINTGYLLESDMASVESLIRAKRAALVMPGQIINLVPVQKAIANVDNKRELVEFDVEFEINRKFNEEIYSF